jgi:hypothetical protein
MFAPPFHEKCIISDIPSSRTSSKLHQPLSRSGSNLLEVVWAQQHFWVALLFPPHFLETSWALFGHAYKPYLAMLAISQKYSNAISYSTPVNYQLTSQTSRIRLAK